MEKLMKILEANRPDIDFKTATKLIDSNILESFDIISIVGDINDEFDIKIGAGDLMPANFNSATAMYELIQAKLKD